MDCKQGDMIGRIFPYWWIINFVLFNYRRSTTYLGTFHHGKNDAIILTKNWLGCTLGDFFSKLIWSP
jgi:hypothetical protein